MRSLLVIENERLINFLDNNQLVQANAVVAKMEGLLRKCLSDPYQRESVYELAYSHMSPMTPGENRLKSIQSIQSPTNKPPLGPIQSIQSQTNEPQSIQSIQSPTNEPQSIQSIQSPTNEPQSIQSQIQSQHEPEKPQYRPEDHPYWPCFRAVHRIKQFILAGTKDKALAEAKVIASRL